MRALLVLAGLVALSACGFNLRGKESVQLPADLRRLRVVTSDRTAYPPLLIEMRNALASQAGVEIAPADAVVPTLTLSSESPPREPVVDISAYASGFILSYKVSFNLKDAAGRDVIAKHTVRVQREYDFDRRNQNVIAKEKEEDFLRAEMQRDAVQQILRRLASVTMPQATPPAAPATSPP